MGLLQVGARGESGGHASLLTSAMGRNPQMNLVMLVTKAAPLRLMMADSMLVLAVIIQMSA